MSAGINPYELNSTTLNFVGQAAPSSAKRESSQQEPASRSSAKQASAPASSDASNFGASIARLPVASNSAKNFASSADESADDRNLERDESGEHIYIAVTASGVTSSGITGGGVPGSEADVKLPENLQRVAEARKQQGFSLRTIARRTGIDLRTLRAHENPKTDMKLSELRAWQLALELPMVDLIEDDLQPLSSPVKDRAMLVKIMKTVVAIKEAGGPPRVQRLATMLFEQMVELMPELQEVGGWPQHGSRRTGNSRIVEQKVNTQSLGIERME